MQIMIDLPEEIIADAKTSPNFFPTYHFGTLWEAVGNGTPLPKGHGDLKDMGNLQYVFDLTREDPIYSGKDIERAIKSMTTLIEADKAGREE